MGMSYDGIYFFGLVYQNDDAEGWPEAAGAVLGGDDFEDWLEGYLGDRFNPGQDYAEWKARLAVKCMERFGVPGFEYDFIGHIEYSAPIIAPVGAKVSRWRGGGVPDWSAEQIAVWRTACERLRAVLPGAGEPGLYYGCSVG